MKLNLFRFCWGLILLGLLPTNVVAQSSVQPELYSYQTFGNRGSSYTSVATGLGIYLMDREDGGPQRYLQSLVLFVPQSSLGTDSKLGDHFLLSSGQGLELVLHDQWRDPVGKGAQISLRHLRWNAAAKAENEKGEPASTTIFHMGWNGSMEAIPTNLVWFVGLDVAQLFLPGTSYGEIQGAVGLRLNW
ncbi:MAG: hypothetical protein ACO4CF_04550 [bacterium]